MSSHLRLQSHFEPVAAKATYQTSPTIPPAKKQKMSLTQTYDVASTARSKLGRETNREDHNLRWLVGHANLLDTLMLDLADAEREQDAWFTQSHQNRIKTERPNYIHWEETIPEQDEEESDDESAAGSANDEDADEAYNISGRNFASPPVQIESSVVELDDDSDEDEENDEQHALMRVPSSRHSPPELMDDSSDATHGTLRNVFLTRVDEDMCRTVTGQVLAGLKYLHKQNIIHRDINPENILVFDNDPTAFYCKLSDFTHARKVTLDDLPGGVQGTPSFMSLECAEDEPCDQRADIFACGKVAFWLLKGEEDLPTDNLSVH
ncbi:hypothetical protein B0A55_12956, partial [Friedmanniomyces simplex]